MLHRQNDYWHVFVKTKMTIGTQLRNSQSQIEKKFRYNCPVLVLKLIKKIGLCLNLRWTGWVIIRPNRAIKYPITTDTRKIPDFSAL